MSRPEPPPPGTWRRDDGATGFQPDGSITSPVSATTPAPVSVVTAPEPLTPVGPALTPCPYCDKFEYEQPEGSVSQEILDHLKAAHSGVWAKMEEEAAEMARQAAEKVEQEFL